MGGLSNSSQSQPQRSRESGDDNFKIATHYPCCGGLVEMKTSWTFKNPGRRFFICPKDIVRGCRFFQWIDPSFPSETRKVIRELMNSKSEMYSFNTVVNVQKEEMKTAIEKLKAEHQGKVAILEGQLRLTKSKNVRGLWLKGICVCLFVLLIATWAMLIV